MTREAPTMCPDDVQRILGEVLDRLAAAGQVDEANIDRVRGGLQEVYTWSGYFEPHSRWGATREETIERIRQDVCDLMEKLRGGKA